MITLIVLFVDLSWFSNLPPICPAPSSAIENNNNDSAVPVQREQASSSLSFQREVDNTISSRSGWNPGHRYNTRYRKKFTAHTCVF